MIIVLGAKSKLDFVDRICMKPNESSDALEQRKRVNYMAHLEF